MSKRWKLWLIAALALAALGYAGWRTWRDVPHPGHLPPHMEGGALGKVRLLPPAGPIKATIALFSNARGWDRPTADLAAELADEGALVIGIDLPKAMALMAAEKGDCLDLQWIVQDLSRKTQRVLGGADYHLPLLAGIGDGATMALRIAGQSSPVTMGGVIAVDPAAGGEPPHALCPASDAVTAGTPIFSDLIVTGHDNEALATTEAARLKAPAPTITEGRPEEVLADAIIAHMQAPPSEEDALAALPLVELPAEHGHGLVALVYSGDGGWRDLDKDVAERLQAAGIPTVGLDMLRYFWARRAPADAARDLSRLIRHYRSHFGDSRIILVGYSFGADVLPALYNLLPAEDRAAVVQISLLALSAKANFEVSFDEWLTSEGDSVQPTLPDLQRIPPALLQCFQGREDEEGICPTLEKRGVETIMTDGGHHFDGDYEKLADRIASGAARRLQGMANGTPP